MILRIHDNPKSYPYRSVPFERAIKFKSSNRGQGGGLLVMHECRIVRCSSLKDAITQALNGAIQIERRQQ